MNEKELNSLAITYVKDKLSLKILNNIYEICEYFEEDSYEDMDISIKKIKNNLPNYFYNIKNILSKDFESRVPFIDNIKQDIKQIEKVQISLKATLNFIDLLSSIISDYYQIKNGEIDDNIKFKAEMVLDIIYTFLDELDSENTIQKNAGLLLSLLSCNMIKMDYKDYITKSLNVLFEKSTEKLVDEEIENLKFKFAPFMYIEDKDFLINIFNKKYESMKEDELLEILENLDKMAEKYSNKIGDIGAIYGCIMDILSIYNFAVDTEYLFKDDFILKDMYYYTCEMIENKDFSTYENIANNMEVKYEQILKNVLKNEEIIKNYIKKIKYDNYTDAIKVCLALEDYDVLNFEKNIIFSCSNSTNNIATQEFKDKKIEEFLSFIDSLDITNIMLKKLKQEFFIYIPCPLNINALKIYFKNALEGLKNETGILITYKFKTLIDSEMIEALEELEQHNCSDECCNHNH
ncbi:hypothetical protein [[Clostridium] colinum]|uniref:hypothetical protein n=1 Tax=[Clostridium] colinum TaxID=36835 RepID=UPI002025A9C8|nr:hypothetical protein [[Clostridium] colinum]